MNEEWFLVEVVCVPLRMATLKRLVVRGRPAVVDFVVKNLGSISKTSKQDIRDFLEHQGMFKKGMPACSCYLSGESSNDLVSVAILSGPPVY